MSKNSISYTYSPVRSSHFFACMVKGNFLFVLSQDGFINKSNLQAMYSKFYKIERLVDIVSNTQNFVVIEKLVTNFTKLLKISSLSVSKLR